MSASKPGPDSASPSHPAVLAPVTTDSTEDPGLSRRGAFIRMMEIGLGIAGAVVLTSGADVPEAEAKKAPPPRPLEPQRALVSMAVVRTDGSSFPTFTEGSTTWLAGNEGERYDLHVQNHTDARVEVVISVDGRDIKIKPEARGYIPIGKRVTWPLLVSMRTTSCAAVLATNNFPGRLAIPEGWWNL